MDKNFWHALKESYPKSVKEFLCFIDEYKKENNWEKLFLKGVKFDHIPIELQLGVWISFLNEQGCGKSKEITLDIDCFETESMWEWCSEWFRHREIDINIENK